MVQKREKLSACSTKAARTFYTRRMSCNPVNIYYVSCPEEGCWVLFNPKPPLPLSLTCRLHGHHLDIADVKQGYVTAFEAKQGWTKQRPG